MDLKPQEFPPLPIQFAQPNLLVELTGERFPALHLLVADADPQVALLCARVSAKFGFRVSHADSSEAAQQVLDGRSVDLLLLDFGPSAGNGTELLEEFHARSPKTIIVIMTATPAVASVLQAMRLGAFDCLIKPFSVEELATVLERSAQRRSFDVRSRALREALRSGSAAGPLVGRSPTMEKIFRTLSKVAFTSHPVLILGESGTGKELVARAIHSNGPNALKPFVPVDCSALVPTLIESELFGHTKGAFTGATQAKTGLLASAGSGTLFLDEIGELPLDLQGRLLRILQEREIRPVGATRTIPFAARVLAATNRDLAAMVDTGRFRKDLFYRLNVVNIRLPPLRDRRSDVLLLSEYMLERLRAQSGINYTLGTDAINLLLDYDWPGNVRELEHSLEHACALTSDPILHATEFPTQLRNNRPATTLTREETTDIKPLAELEKQAIFRAIRQFNGDKLMAARLLGIGKTTLYRKLKEYELEKQADAASASASPAGVKT